MYQTDTRGGGRKRIQDVNRVFHRFHELSIVSSEIAKDLCQFLKNGGDGIDRVARFKLLGERMIDQASFRLVLIVLESSVEEVFEGG